MNKPIERQGGFAEYVSIPDQNIYELPKTLDMKEAPIAEPTAVALHAVELGEKDQGCKMINGVEKQYPKANQSIIQKAKYESQKFECKQNS